MLIFVLFHYFPVLRETLLAAMPQLRVILFDVRRALAARLRVFLTLFLAAFTLVGTASAADGMEARRLTQNSINLQKMSPSVRGKMRGVISDMEGAGYKPIIDNQVWRSKSEQLALYKKGVTKVTYSFHNVSTKAGKADSLAADITDQRFGWTGHAPRRYWFCLARSAYVHGLYSGAHFGLSAAQRAKFDQALHVRDFGYSGPLGWDVAHIEPRGITIRQAKAGIRPYSIVSALLSISKR
jgi:membrane protein implicated in regulation of membrane protease activity